jgi:dTDP-4-amino-4,6-dideoxygalactose transaminase
MNKPSKTIRLSKSCLSDAEKQAVMDVIDRGYLGMGAEVQQFEEALTDFFGRPAICVVNGTAALHLAIQACGFKAGDEVLVPSLTYVASFQAISATGAQPVACDIDPVTLTLNCCDAEARITPRTKALMPVHYSGGVGDLVGIYSLAAKYNLRVIEDAAHAFGTIVDGRRVGSYGDISCFSFDGVKNITSGEGGCILTDNEMVLRRCRDARLLGVEHDSERRYSGHRSWDFDVTEQGWRYHMSNIMAAIGLQQLARFPEMRSKRQALAIRYSSLLASNSKVKLLAHNYTNVVPHIFVIRIAGLTNREQLRQNMLDDGIQTGIHYKTNHLLSLYKNAEALPLPVTEAIYPELLTLPMHSDMLERDVDFVCERLCANINL